MTEKEWAEELVSNVAAEVKRIRKRDKISVRALAERTKDLGHPIGESVLSNFEYGRRGAKLDVVELLVLAAALGVPPALLLFPNYPDGLAEYLPGRTATAFDATRWLAGEVGLTDSGEVKYGDRMVGLARGRNTREESLPHLVGQLAQAESEDQRKFWQDQIDQTQKVIRIQNREMRREGGVVDDE